MIYTLLGYFGMNPIMKERNVMISQDFYRIDSDYPKDKCFPSFANQVPHKLYTCGFVYESVNCISTVYYLWLTSDILFPCFSLDKG